MKSRSRSVLAAVLLAASVTLAACGGSDGTAHAGDDSSASAGSQDGSYTPLTLDTFADAVSAATKSQESARMEVRVGSVLHTTAAVDRSSSQPKADLKTTFSYDGKDITSEVRVLDGITYIRVSGLTPSGKFVKVDSNTPALAKMSKSLKSSDPSTFTKAFSTGLSKVKYLGEKQIGGSTTHRYAVTMDSAKVLGALGTEGLGQSGGTSMPKSVTGQVYLNPDNTLRRGVLQAKGQRARFDITGWGQPVSVEAPPKDEVVTLPEGKG